MSQLFASGGQSIGASALASVLSMNIQGWSPLGLTGWISLQSKGLSRVFSNTTVQKHQFFGTQPSLWSDSHICTWLLEKPQLWLEWTFVSKMMSLLFNTVFSFGLYWLKLQMETTSCPLDMPWMSQRITGQKLTSLTTPQSSPPHPHIYCRSHYPCLNKQHYNPNHHAADQTESCSEKDSF